jgi:hypothetical protein
VPALAFNQTTGINIHIITPLVMSICIFYTTLVREKFISGIISFGIYRLIIFAANLGWNQGCRVDGW